MNSLCKQSFRILSVVMILALASSAHAIFRYRLVPLPHLGYGGVAMGVPAFRPSEYPLVTVGQVRDAGGNTHACLWRSATNWSLEPLPGINGRNSFANDATYLDDGTGPHLRIVGSAENLAGVRKPILWTEESYGSFTPHVLPTLGGGDGMAMSVFAGHYDNGQFDGGFAIVGTTRTSLGDLHATFWRQTPTGIETIDLGTLGGPNSYASAVDLSAPRVYIVGSADTGTGDRHACSWRFDWDDSAHRVITDLHPLGANSIFHDCTGPYGCGTATSANGKSLGFFDTWDWEFMSPQHVLPPISGSHNSSGDGIFSTLYGAQIIGVSWDNSNEPLLGIWNHIASLDRTRGYPISAVVDSAAQDVGTISLLSAIGDNEIAGAVMDPLLGVEAPMVLLEEEMEMPDMVMVTTALRKLRFEEMDLWQANDNQTLRIPSMNGDGDRAVVEMSFFGEQVDPLSPLDMVTRSRVIGNAKSSAEMMVEIFDFTRGVFAHYCSSDIVAGDHQACIFTQTPQWSTFPTSILAADHVDPNTGEVRVRLTFRATGPGVRGYELDLAAFHRIY